MKFTLARMGTCFFVLVAVCTCLTSQAVAQPGSRPGTVTPTAFCDYCDPDPPPNVAPSVTLTSPSNGQVFVAGTVVTVTASASDFDGTISRVDLRVDGVKAGGDSTAPYSFNWTSTVGAHNLMVVAYDNAYDDAADAVTVTVNANKVPTVALTAPTSGQTFVTGSVVTLAASAADTDGTITRVNFLVDGTKVGEDTTLPYSYPWTSTVGNHTVIAQAADNLNGIASSTGIAITVNKAPAISITAPADGASYTAPANINITASANDTDGTISKVEFYSGTTLLGTDTTSPYSYSWSNVPAAASYTLKARAIDNLGGITDSATRSVTVNAPPTVSLSRSPTSAALASPADVTLTATASDSDGSISKVEFYSGTTLLGTDTTSPYSYGLTGLTSLVSGGYSFTAKAYDNRGAAATSAANTLTVTAPASGPSSVTRRYVYDANQQLCKVIEPETGATVMDYDAAGSLVWSASGLDLPDPNACNRTEALNSGRELYRIYDPRNRVQTLSFPDNLGDTDYTYTPDGLPDTISVDNGGGNVVTTSYTYNRRRLLIGETMAWGSILWDLSYAYDANGHLSGQAYPDGLSVPYAPNALGQPTQVGAYATQISYYPNGAIQQFTYGNGIVHTLTQNARQLPDTSRDAYGSTEFLDDGYDYDANGNVAAISDGLGTAGHGNRTMTYDGLDRLKTVVSPMYGSTGAHYQYDALDNLVRVTTGGAAARDHGYCYDSNNRLTNVKVADCGGATVIGLGYDVQGNLNNKNGVTYTFDYGNRLRSAGGSPASSYVYDGHGRRVRDFTTASKYSLYSQSGQLMYSSDLRKNVRANYVYLGGSLVAIREFDVATSVYTTKYQHTDALGSPVAVTDASRTVLERMEYEPFGQVLAPSTPKDGPGYTGHVLDAATGLNYMQQRYYDPMLGKTLSVDPVTAYEQPITNFCRYCYARNNPYRFTDPDGRQAAERFVEQHRRDMEAGNGKVYEPFVPVAVAVTAIMAAPVLAVAGKEIGMAALANPGSIATATEVAAGAAGVTGTAGAVAKTITLSTRAQGQSAQHVKDAIAAGQPSVLTIAREGASANRAASIGGMAKVPGKHLDEYPPAMFKEGGAGASVRAINPADNMSAGACIGNACRGLVDGTRVRIEVGD